MEAIRFQELIWEQKKINVSDMFWLQIVTKLNERGRIHIYCHKHNKNSIVYLGHIFQYTLKMSSVNNESPASGPNERALGPDHSSYSIVYRPSSS